MASNFSSGFLQEKRNTFDIHKYGTSVLDRLTESEATQSTPWVPFSKVVETEPQYEVCRMLLASLQLVSSLSCSRGSCFFYFMCPQLKGSHKFSEKGWSQICQLNACLTMWHHRFSNKGWSQVFN